MNEIKKAILKKSYWRGMQFSLVSAFYPAGTEVQVYRGKGRRSYTVLLHQNEYDNVGGTWKGATSDLKFIK